MQLSFGGPRKLLVRRINRRDAMNAEILQRSSCLHCNIRTCSKAARIFPRPFSLRSSQCKRSKSRKLSKIFSFSCRPAARETEVTHYRVDERASEGIYPKIWDGQR